MTPIGTDKELIVRLRKYGHIEAADALLSRIAEVERLRVALPIFERVTRLAHTLSGDVPITAASRKHIQAAYDELAALSQHGKV